MLISELKLPGDDFKLEDDEVTGSNTGFIKRTGKEVAGVVVDKSSGEGQVLLGVNKDPIYTGKQYNGVDDSVINEDDVCHVYGCSTVFFYKKK